MEAAAISFSRSFIKPIPYRQSFEIKDEEDAKRLQKARLKLKNLVFNEYVIIQKKLGGWNTERRPLRIQKACCAHLKGLFGLHLPFVSLKIPFLMFSKQTCCNLRNLSMRPFFSDKRKVKRFEKHLTRMKHLTSFTDLDTTDSQQRQPLFKLKSLEHIRSLALSCLVTPKRLDKLRKISICLEKLEKSGEIPKLPLGLRELSLIDKKSLDEKSREEIVWKFKDQLNSLKNLKSLNLVVFQKKSYCHQSNLFSDLELKNLTITMKMEVSFSDEMLLEMENYVERTDSRIKIIPSGISLSKEYLRLLNLLEKRQESNKQGIQLEKILYPFNSTTEEVQREIMKYYCQVSAKEVEFMFEFDSVNGWLDKQNIVNFKKMMEIIGEKESTQNPKIIYHFICQKHMQLTKAAEKEMAQVVIDLFKFKGRKIVMKVSCGDYGYRTLKPFLTKLFQESSLKVEKIYWENHYLYVAEFPQILNDWKARNKIKDYSLITYHR